MQSIMINQINSYIRWAHILGLQPCDKAVMLGNYMKIEV